MSVSEVRLAVRVLLKCRWRTRWHSPVPPSALLPRWVLWTSDGLVLHSDPLPLQARSTDAGVSMVPALVLRSRKPPLGVVVLSSMGARTGQRLSPRQSLPAAEGSGLR